MDLVFATNNSHKLQEITEKLRACRGGACFDFAQQPRFLNLSKDAPTPIRIISLSDIGFSDEIPETGTTFHENALQKAQTIYDYCHINCFADDSGLEIEALNGAPGVYSAMYAEAYAFLSEGVQSLSGVEMKNTPNFDDNINLVLSQLHGKTNRRACFKSVIALILDGEIHYFEGRVDGEIITEKRGTKGFGYDPIFIPNGYNETFAELSIEEKNNISHRGRAVEKLIAFLSGL